MTTRAWLAAGAIVFSGSTGSACHHEAQADAVTPATYSDSLVGIVSVTGTSFEQRIVLRVHDEARALAASSADSEALSRLSGVEIVVRGRLRRDAFEVATFEARRVTGAPVADGVLRRDGGRFVLETQSGALALGNPPATLDMLVGARIWISGPLDTGPNSYGVIVPPGAPRKP